MEKIHKSKKYSNKNYIKIFLIEIESKNEVFLFLHSRKRKETKKRKKIKKGKDTKKKYFENLKKWIHCSRLKQNDGSKIEFEKIYIKAKNKVIKIK